jgi:hypothetical protein
MIYRKPNKLNQADAAYIAGLVDGEGTVTLSCRNSYKNRGLVVTISNNELSILEYAQFSIGVGKITKKRHTSDRHNPSYTYCIAYRQALSLLEQVSPFLKSHKAARAALVLKEYLRLTPRNGRYTQMQIDERDAFVTEFFNIRASRSEQKLRQTLLWRSSLPT